MILLRVGAVSIVNKSGKGKAPPHQVTCKEVFQLHSTHLSSHFKIYFMNFKQNTVSSKSNVIFPKLSATHISKSNMCLSQQVLYKKKLIIVLLD